MGQACEWSDCGSVEKNSHLATQKLQDRYKPLRYIHGSLGNYTFVYPVWIDENLTKNTLKAKGKSQTVFRNRQSLLFFFNAGLWPLKLNVILLIHKANELTLLCQALVFI